MRNLIFILFITIIFCFQKNLYAQSDSKIYEDVFFKSALKSIKNMQFNKAIENLELFSSNSFAKRDIRTLKILADCYWKVRRYKEAKNCYDTLLTLNSFYSQDEKFHISELYAMSGNYFKAAEYLNGIPGFENKMNGYNNVAIYLKDSLDFQLSLNFNIVENLLMPMIKKDSLLWVSKSDILSSPKNSFIAKYFSNKENNQFNELVDSSAVVTNKNSIFSRPNTYSYSSISGSIFFTMFQDYLSKIKMEGPNYFRIAESKINGSKIKDINLFTLGVGSYSMLQPVISPDGNLLVFISNINNNQFDLFFSKKNGLGSWSSPTALKSLNTPGDEVFPCFGLDGYLYFSSNGRAGLGGLDIYKVFLKLNGGDDIVTHLSYPINSRHDDYDFNISKDGYTGSFISKRSGDDIVYNVEYRKHYLKMIGSVISEVSALPISDVKVYLFKLGDKNAWIPTDSTYTNESGEFAFPVSNNTNYKVYYLNEYNNFNIDISIVDNPSLDILQNVPLKDYFSSLISSKKKYSEVAFNISRSKKINP